jgi:hypothetical protein
MAKTWVLDTETKGTGAHVVPLDTVVRSPAEREAGSEGRPGERPAKGRAGEPRRRHRLAEPERTTTALPPGHVRKKATGEIGKVLAVDPRAGTATVRWLKRGATSTVPLSTVARR